MKKFTLKDILSSAAKWEPPEKREPTPKKVAQSEKKSVKPEKSQRKLTTAENSLRNLTVWPPPEAAGQFGKTLLFCLPAPFPTL